MMAAMRALFASTANAGHFRPMLPVIRACVAAGWEVAVATPASYATEVQSFGLVSKPFADVPPALMGAVFSRLPSLAPGEADLVVIQELFGRLDPQAALPGLAATIADWRPDLVVREQVEFGSAAAACAAGVPQAQVAIGMAQLGGAFFGVLREPLAELADYAGVTRTALLEEVAGSPTITSVPVSLNATEFVPTTGFDPVEVELGPVWRFAPEAAGLGGELPAAWGDPGLPLVYVSFGSVIARLPISAGLYDRVLAALAAEPIRVLLTLGVPLEDAGLRDVIPANTRVESWWPQAAVMGAAGAMVGHGGFGTTMAALEAGVPQVVAPLFTSDQRVNAEQINASGAGIAVTGGLQAIDRVVEPLRRILTEPTFRQRAAELAAEMRAQPALAELPPMLEDLLAR